ncbi:MAG: glycosyltransferase [Terricaulis sp.]
MSIAFVGDSGGTSGQRLAALTRLGHRVTHVDPYAALAGVPFSGTWTFKTGALGLADFIKLHVLRALGDKRFDLVFVDSGDLIGPALVRDLKARSRVVVNYNVDNPFVPRDGRRWRLFLRALPHYDLFVTPRRANVDDAYRAGAKHVLRVTLSADEITHSTSAFTPEDLTPYKSEVAFVGTWMPERGPIMARLVEKGVPLRIFGNRWNKAPEYKTLAPHITLGALNGADYVKAVAGTQIALALLSKGNEDLHTQRSLEIPAIGRLLCGERTSDHVDFYREGEEAVFWSDADECAALCLSLLSDPARIDRIAAAGAARVRANQAFNEPILARILDEAFAPRSLAAAP